FGRILLQRTDQHGTQWALSAIPLGGYVKMLDTAGADASPQERAQAFDAKPLWQRSLVVGAGPAANLVLAVVLYALLNWAGYQEPTAIIATPPEQSLAAQAGLHGGEQITAVDGAPVASWNQLRWQLLNPLADGGRVSLEALSESGARRDYTLDLVATDIAEEKNDPRAELGLTLALPRARVTEVLADSAGEQGGLQAGDVIVGIEDIREPDPTTLVDLVSRHADQPLSVQVSREGTELSFFVTPRAEQDEDGLTVGRIGVMLGADLPMTLVRHGLFDGLSKATTRTMETAGLSLRMLGRMVTGQASLRNLSGPVTIADYAGQT